MYANHRSIFISTLVAPSHTHENDVGEGDRGQNRPHGHVDPGSKKKDVMGNFGNAHLRSWCSWWWKMIECWFYRFFEWMYTYMYIYIFTYAHTHTYIYIYIIHTYYIYTYIYIYTYMYNIKYIMMCIYIYDYIYVDIITLYIYIIISSYSSLCYGKWFIYNHSHHFPSRKPPFIGDSPIKTSISGRL